MTSIGRPTHLNIEATTSILLPTPGMQDHSPLRPFDYEESGRRSKMQVEENEGGDVLNARYYESPGGDGHERHGLDTNFVPNVENYDLKMPQKNFSVMQRIM